MVYPDDQSWSYFWLPKGIELAVLAHCEREGVTFDQLLAEKLAQFTNHPDYRHRMLEWACTDVGWPDDAGDCLAVAALRARRYHEGAETLLLKLSPEALTIIDQEAIRQGLEYDQLAAKFIIERLRRLNGEESLNRATEGGEEIDEHDPADLWKDDRLDET